MPEDLFLRLTTLPPESVVLFLFLAVARPFGLMFGFVAFFWGFGAGMFQRLSIALAFGMPMALASTDQIIGSVLRQSLAEMIVILAKEIVLGLALGILASLPFFALKAGGEIVDSFRGETDSGHHDPADASISTLGTVFLILGFLIFFASGGLWQLIGMLYQSYSVWAVVAPFPTLSADAGLRAAGLVWQMLALGILVAAPMLLLLMAAELLLIVGARLAPKLHLDQNEFLIKNLVAVLILPVAILYVARIAERHLPESLTALPLLQGFLP